MLLIVKSKQFKSLLVALGKVKQNSAIIMFEKIKIMVARRVCDRRRVYDGREVVTEVVVMEISATRATTTKWTMIEEEQNNWKW